MGLGGYRPNLKNINNPTTMSEDLEDLETDNGSETDNSLEPEPTTNESENEELDSYEASSIIINITLLPQEAIGERKVILSASNLGDPPVSRLLQENDLMPLPPAILDLLDELKADFPNRQTRRKVKALKQQTTKERANKTSASSGSPTTKKVLAKPNPSKQLTFW